jgi:hypothetical protein
MNNTTNNLTQYPNPFETEPCISKQARVLSDISHVLEGAESIGATAEDILESGFNAFQIDSILLNVTRTLKEVQDKLNAFGNQMELELDL